MKVWGYVGQGTIAVTCIARRDVAHGGRLPCVIGGAVTSAALNYWTAQ